MGAVPVPSYVVATGRGGFGRGSAGWSRPRTSDLGPRDREALAGPVTDLDGHQRKENFHTRAEADKRVAEVDVEIRSGSYVVPAETKQTLGSRSGSFPGSCALDVSSHPGGERIINPAKRSKRLQFHQGVLCGPPKGEPDD